MIIITNKEVFIKEKEYRITKQCQLIYNQLYSLSSHPTAEDLYNEVKKYDSKISLGTVYRNLEKLKNQGKVKKIGAGTNKFHWDATVENHMHLRCNSCQKITDLFDTSLNSLKNKVVRMTGFDKLKINMEITGICPKCNERGK